LKKKNKSSPFVKAFMYASESMPPEKCLYVLQDNSGWLYINQLVKREGLKTPFSSIEEIEIYLKLKLKLLKELKPPSE